MRGLVVVLVVASARLAVAGPAAVRCDNLSTADLAIDGLLDDWGKQILAREGTLDSGLTLRCSWDGTALALAIEVKDDRVVRVRGKGHEDHVEIAIAAGATPARATVWPGNAIAKAKITAPRRVAIADSLQPRGFSIEARFPAATLPGFSPSTPSLELRIVFHDADLAAGGADHDVELAATIELGDRKDLLDDFLRTVKLRRADLRFDAMAELDLARRGKERIVAGGTVIGVLTDQFAYVTLPAGKPADVRRIELLPLGPRGQQVISAVVRQTGNGGSRDVLLLWTVDKGQLAPIGQIELRKERGANVLESSWKLTRGKPELVVEPRPAIGFTAETWNEIPAGDADPIVAPWEPKAGVAYTLGPAGELVRRELKKRR